MKSGGECKIRFFEKQIFGQDHFDLCKQGVTMCGELPL